MDWIKMRTDLYRDPKVICMADILSQPDSPLSDYVSQVNQRDMSVTRNVMRNVTVGALVTVWGVTRHQGRRDGDDLVLDGVRPAVIDDIAEIPGFGQAMESVGWLKEIDLGLVLPKFFARHNVDPADDLRAKNRERQRRYRDKNRNVTVTSRNAPREEKSKSIDPPPPPTRGFTNGSNHKGGGGGGFCVGDLEERLFRLDVRKAADATQSLRSHGATLDDIEGLLAEFEKRRGEFTAPGGALYTRLMAWRPGQSAEDLWPEDPEAAKRRKERERSKREKERVLREMEARRKEAGRC